MHAGIALLMGLVTFSWVMITIELPLLGDRRLEAIGVGLRHGAQRFANRIPIPVKARSA